MTLILTNVIQDMNVVQDPEQYLKDFSCRSNILGNANDGGHLG